MSLRKIIKFLCYSAAGIVSVLLLAYAIAYGLTQHRLNRRISVTVASVSVPTDAASIERGRHIVTTRACSDCHGADFGGKKVIDDPMTGVFHAPNLTHGKGGLPANFSDEDYVRAIRHGLSHDGRALTLMPSMEYAELSDEDLGSVIAYLKTLAPVDRERGPISPGPLIRVLVALGKVSLPAEHIDHTSPRLASVTPGINANYGKYLASSCTGCHGPNLSGGKIAAAPPDWPAAANLTRDASSRITGWTEEQFIRTVRTRERPDGTKLNPIMPAAFAEMTDVELKALWSYLATLPPTPTGVR